MRSVLLGHDALGRAVELTAADRETHMHVIGSSGSGKSKFLEQMMRGDLDNRQGFCLIDPHGSLYEDVVNYCSHKVLSREMLSAKNRLLRLLTSETLARFFNTEHGGIDLAEIIDKGKVLLVNLASSPSLSDENGRVFGALLLNEFFQAARRRRAAPGKALVPYYLYLDEFQTFVTLDVASMLDQVRKYKVFAVLAHQRFGQLDLDLTDAVLTNCRIKAVFGGLPVEMARMMAQELFIGELDPMRIKVAIYQTKFWPQYGRDRVYTKSGSRGRSTGRGENITSGDSAASVQGQFFEAQQWYSGDLVGTSMSMTAGTSSASGNHWNETDFEGEGEGVADVPILIPVPFQELSSVQYYTLEEQLTELTAALKGQFGRHCFIKIHHQKTQPLLVPFIRKHYTSDKFIADYQMRKLAQEGAQAAAVVDECIARQDEELRRSATGPRAKGPEVECKERPPSWEDLLGRE